MQTYAIIETEAGFTVAEVPEDKTVEAVAAEMGGAIVDPGPHKSFEEARDAMLMLPGDENEQARLRD